MIRKLALTFVLLAPQAEAQSTYALCGPFSSAATPLDPSAYLDRADPLTERVAQPLEAALLDAQTREQAPAPLQKLYCSIGMFELVIRFVQPVEDDAQSATVTEATYGWNAEEDPAGWQITDLRRHHACARGEDPFAEICP